MRFRPVAPTAQLHKSLGSARGILSTITSQPSTPPRRCDLYEHPWLDNDLGSHLLRISVPSVFSVVPNQAEFRGNGNLEWDLPTGVIWWDDRMQSLGHRCGLRGRWTKQAGGQAPSLTVTIMLTRKT